MTPASRILNPQAVPVAGTDAHLPPVPAPALTADALRQRFGQREPWLPEFPGDDRLLAGREPAHAAVLVALVQRGDGLHVLLTRRTEHLRDHAGQVSFPGGRSEASDADPEATALREAEEEVGLARGSVEVIGRMPAYTTITRYVVTPVVALVQPPFELALDAFEVAEAFEVPLAFLMNPRHHERRRVVHGEIDRTFYAMPWRCERRSREYFIWGATAAMLRNLYRLLSA